MSRHSSPTTRPERNRPAHKDVPSTIRINERESRTNTGKHHSRHRPDPSTSLRLRSRSREHRTRQRNQRGLFEREPGVHIRAKARPTTPAPRPGTPQPEPEPPQTFAESLEMVIPASVDIPPSDWSQLSPELQEQGQEEEEEPTYGNGTMWPDRTTTVKKAYEDPSRTKAACELVQAGIMCLAQRVRTEKYETFLRILHSRNPSTPQMILGNMASIFASSGKMTRTQAGGSYTFKVSDTVGFGLLVPTLFRHKPGFQDDTSNLYYIIHGATSKRASRILAEELIRPGDFSMHQDPHQSGFPAYGQKSEEAILSPLKLKQLTKKILRTSQGSMAAFICGIYAGLHPHQKHRVASNDEAQVLCGRYGIARGPQLFGG